MWFAIVIIFAAGYLLGNLNGAVCVSLSSGEDVRSHGSGNAGLTNFVRTYGYGKAGLVIFIDVAKAVAACLLGRLLLAPYGYGLEGATLGGVAVSIGHDFPALLRFRGGKGILCGLTVAFMMDWRCAVLLAAVFVILVAWTKYVSVGSIAASALFSLYFGIVYHGRFWVCIGGIFIGLLAIFMHRKNIVRLLHHNENKLSLKKKIE